MELHKLGWSEVRPEVVPAAAEDRYCVCGRRPKDAVHTLVIPVQLHEQASLDRLLSIHDAMAKGSFGRAMLALVSDDTIILENIQAGLHFEFCDMKKKSGKRRGGKSGERERQRAKLREQQQQQQQEEEQEVKVDVEVEVEFKQEEEEAVVEAGSSDDVRQLGGLQSSPQR